uniref:hypothetical protein n=1 Tax=Pararhizobium sp. IMCC3301 TaxID=3067904 RepID=UPI0027420EC6|nr:hypothetical protein [Pararhizobium sp. IMCC3301]
MVRKGRYKLVYYTLYPPQLFDLTNDPEELADLSLHADAQPIMEDLKAELLKVSDPEAMDRDARAMQAELLAKKGGRDAVIARGDLGFSVPPGFQPQFD